MAVDLESFLSPVVEAAASMAQIRDLESNDISADDPLILECAKISYAQISSYCNRSFLKDTGIVEYYNDEEARILLREGPVTAVTTVETEDGTLVVDTDYQVEKDWVIIGASTEDQSKHFDFSLYNIDLKLNNVRVTYNGGFDTAADNTNLLSALATQTIANYNRKDNLGIVRAQGQAGGGQIHLTDTYNPDAGNIVETAIFALSPLVYYGTAVRV